MPIGDLYRVADQYQAQLRRRDAATLQQLAQAYGRIYQQATANFELVNQFILAKLEANQIVTAGRVIRSAQGRELIQQTRTALDSYGEYAAGVVSNAQEQAAVAALTESERLLRVGLETGLAETVQLPGGRTLTDILPAFQRVPTEAVNQLVGTLGDGTPLRDYFLGGTANVPALSDDVIDSIRATLEHGLAAGWNPQRTAQQFRQSMGVGLTRAMRIARTETLRSYREASRMNYVANGIEEWEWLATLDGRTCLACLALDGTTYPTEQPQQAHVNCRCTMVPVLPFSVPRVRRSGAGSFEGTAGDWFDSLQPSEQRTIMGPSKYKAYTAGVVRLRDFVGEQTSPTFGTNFVEASLVQLLGAEANQYYAN